MSTVVTGIVCLIVGYWFGRSSVRPRPGYQPKSGLVLDVSRVKPPKGGTGAWSPKRKHSV